MKPYRKYIAINIAVHIVWVASFVLGLEYFFTYIAGPFIMTTFLICCITMAKFRRIKKTLLSHMLEQFQDTIDDIDNIEGVRFLIPYTVFHVQIDQS